MTTATKATGLNVGCWIDGHWGLHGIPRLVEIAQAHDYVPRDEYAAHLAVYNRPSCAGAITDDDAVAFVLEESDLAEIWLNDNVAPEGLSFGWADGEFYLWGSEDWASIYGDEESND